MIALKAAWEVRAGVIPGQPIAQFTKRWTYTSQEHMADEAKGSDPANHSIFAQKRALALDYYLQVSLPHLHNWAELTFIWY